MIQLAIPPSTLAKRPVEILDQVLDILDPAAQAHQASVSPISCAHRGRHRGVGHAGRVADQALHAAERLGQREDPCRLDEAARPARRRRLERDHAAESAHLPAGELVLRMGRAAPGSTPSGRPARSASHSATRPAVGVVLPHAQRQRLDAAERQPAVHRAGHRRPPRSGGSRSARPGRRGASRAARRPCRCGRSGTWWWSGAPRRRRTRAAAGSTGVAKVLSTTNRSPRAWVRSPTAARSTRSIIGLVGVSQ